MSNHSACLAASLLALGSLLSAAQTSAPPRPQPPAPKQIDIGAADAPLSDSERADLDAAVRKHNYATEKAVIDKALAEHPDSAPLLVMWGRMAYLEKQPKDAADALQHASKIKELSEPDMLTLAVAYQFSDRPDESRSELLKLVARAPKNAEYVYMLGRIEDVGHQTAAAAADFAKAIQLDPSLVRAYEDLGHAQEALGRMDEARKTYEAGAAANRKLKSPWEWSPLDLGNFLLLENDYAAAEKLFREALLYNPRFGWSHYYMGQLYYEQGRDDEALAEFKEAVVDDQRLREAWLALGRVFKRKGNNAESERALAIFQKLEDQDKTAQGKK